MRSGLNEQFQTFKDIILSNVKSIQSLVIQSEELHSIIKKDGTKTPDNTQANLERIKKNIDDVIKQLVQETTKLFATYDELIIEIKKFIK